MCQIKQKRFEGFGLDLSVGESLEEMEEPLDEAGRPFWGLQITWEQIFPLPTAAALIGALAR